MATKSQFDPENVDGEFYSQNPNQHGDSDYGRVSEGVGTNEFRDATSGMDMDTAHMRDNQATKESHAREGEVALPTGESFDSTQGWDVDPRAMIEGEQTGRLMSDEAAAKLSAISENPSDEALFDRNDATYLEAGDNPNQGYDPHNKGYDHNPKEQGSDRQ
ncbi:hypothetical protein F5984_15540 [Rudanella paleaurantiibacter]|uniref:Uncharacterized protein n=1 Tax=Rudanella paleaurantiibacter TaxID=2614655 RepID=A0A7J5TWQ3_9BACT|nr:hypothetical protein [Rudanella paleaurantiibacter]KAB7729062.1 hypothetical protein F5984_15540 [Rudanella paleaurantiibacter]